MTMLPPWAVMSPMRAAGFPQIRTVIEPLTMLSGGPTQVHMQPTVAEGMPPMRTVGPPGVQMGPPTCGTGGTPGVPYLQSTLGKRAFPELWSLRTRL
jgi:hypothetical protein